MVADLDSVDLRMLELLRSSGRMSVNALANAIGVSRANAYRRLDRLQDEGVIRGFTVRVDPSAVGRPVAALIFITVKQRRWRDVQVSLADMEGLEHLATTAGGDFDFLALVRVPDVSTLRDIVLDRLHSIPGVENTRTVFVLDELLP